MAPVGQRLLPQAIDEIARSDPDRPWASMPKASDLTHGYRDVSFAALANAINRLSWFLESQIGCSTTFETLAYIGAPDMRYHMMSMAVAKTGYKMLASSHTNSLAGHLNLLEKTNCNILVYADSVDVNDILGARRLRQVIVPELEELLAEKSVPLYPFKWGFDEARMNPYLVLHTSGSTGLPKPIVIPHAYIANLDAQLRIGEEAGGPPVFIGYRPYNSKTSIRSYTPFQPFHAISLVASMADSVFSTATYVFGPSDRPQTLETAREVIENAKCDTAFVPPSLLEEFAKGPESLKVLSNLSSVMYAGGALSQAAGDAVSEVTRLVQLFGSTEMGVLILRYTDPEDWQYLAFDSYYNGIEWRPAGDDLYELVVIKKPEAAPYQPVFTVFPELDEWPTSDVYSKHSTKPDKWLYKGRIDDLLCFAHGVKYHSLGYELQLAGHPLVQSALMIGDKRQQPALLIELADSTVPADEDDREKVIEDIWPTIAAANADAPSIAQVARTHVLFTNPDKPFMRVGKLTVQRRATIALYEEEISRLYEQVGDVALPMVTRLNGF